MSAGERLDVGYICAIMYFSQTSPLFSASLNGPNPLPPDRMTPAERRDELCAILALGLVRLNARKSSEQSAPSEHSSLDLPRNQSGHATPTHRRTA